MKSEFRCSAAARAACELRKVCGEEATFFEGSQCYDFNQEIERKAIVKTNADRIRAMSDEELAKFLNFLVKLEFCLNTGSDSCEECELSEICNLYPGQELDWLQHPVKEDNHA